jgi:phosphoserine phosphatase
MQIKAFISDFDGTLVSVDMLDVLCGIVGKEDASRKLKEDFITGKGDGLLTLKQRIDFLRGVTASQISAKLVGDAYLRPGAHELFAYLYQHGIRTILQSGNILPVLQYYQERLGISDLVGTKPRMKGNTILGIEMEDFLSRNFKAAGCKAILDSHGISKENVVAIGDAPADAAVFALSGLCIAVDPKGDIAEKAHHIVANDLTAVIEILKKVSNSD